MSYLQRPLGLAYIGSIVVAVLLTGVPFDVVAVEPGLVIGAIGLVAATQ